MAKRGENIYKRKDGRYEGRYILGHCLDGRIRFGYIYAYNYAEVKTALNRAKATVNTVKSARIVGKGNLADFLRFWLENTLKKQVKLSTYAQYYERIEKHIIPALGKVPLNTLNTEQVQHFANELSCKGLSATTTANITRLLYSAMRHAVTLHCAAANPCEGLYLPKKEEDIHPQVLSRSEQIRLEQQIDKMNPCLCCAVYIALYAGLRIGELCALKWQDIDFHNGTLTVRKTLQRVKNFEDDGAKTRLVEDMPKSRHSQRSIPIPSDLREKLKRYRENSSAFHYVLTQSEKPMEPRTLRAQFSRAARLAGLSIKFHALRHTFATRCLEHNFDIQALSEFLGHANANITSQVYAHSLLEHKRMLAERMQILSSPGKPSAQPSAVAITHRTR